MEIKNNAYSNSHHLRTNFFTLIEMSWTDDKTTTNFKLSDWLHEKALPAAVAALLMGAASFSNALALAWVHDRLPYQSDPLPDLWFSAFPLVLPEAIKFSGDIY